MGIVLHRILYEYLDGHREDETAVVPQPLVYVEGVMAWMANVEQVAILLDEVDFLGNGHRLLVELVHDVAIDGGELQSKSLGKLWVFADEFGERAQTVEHEVRVELQLQELLLHLYILVALLNHDAAVVKAEIDDGEQRGASGEHIKTVSENFLPTLVNPIDHTLKADSDEDIGDEHRPTVQEELGEGRMPLAKQSLVEQSPIKQHLADEVGDG